MTDAPLRVQPAQELRSQASQSQDSESQAVKSKAEAEIAASKSVAAPAPAPECVTITYRHRASAKHKLGEECVLHGNRLELPQVLRDAKFTSFCVRVDGVAVRAQREKNHFTLAATRKPTSVISVQGCPKDKACAQDCTPARDAFMDGLVGDDSGAGQGAGQGAGWKGEADAVAALDPAVKRELAALDEESMSDAWDSGSEPTVVSACGVAHASQRGK